MAEASPSSRGPSGSSRTDPSRVREHLIVIGLSSVVLLVASLVARAQLTTADVRLFRAMNELPEGLDAVVTPFMQYGTFVTIPTLAVIALLFRVRLALAVLLAGVGVYLLALLTKQLV